MSNSPFLQVTASILATIQQNAEFVRNRVPVHELHVSDPLFDTRPLPSHRKDATAISSHVSSLGLPDDMSLEVATILSEHTSGYQTLVDQTQQRLLHDLSTTTTSLNPTLIPSLVGAACGVFYNSTIDAGLSFLKEQIHVLDGTDHSQSDPEDQSDSGSDSEDSDDAGDDAEQGDENLDQEDENAPMKPGEEVPPLETKYLPIFEALHERGKVLTKPEKTYLVNMTGMTYRQITIWFQNRRRGELKESSNALAHSRASSVHSDDSSGVSDSELKLEERLNGFQQSDTTFSIRSWQLASAAAQDVNAIHLPPSPTKCGFGAGIISSNEYDDDSDLSDTDDEGAIPPGLNVPSLTTSVSRLDSSSDFGPPTIVSDHSSRAPPGFLPPAIEGDVANSTIVTTFARPIKPLPVPRRHPPSMIPTSSQSSQLSSGTNAITGSQGHSHPTQGRIQSPQLVTSNERGLTVELKESLPSSTSLTTILRTPPAPSAQNFLAPFAGTPPSTSPDLAAGSPHNPSSSPSRHSTVSPRPAIKPLPRRTGCAPRPRPPPRTGTVPAAKPTSSSSSARASVVLPPISNPSLASTTLGALLRPNLPVPTIPAEMEERLAAMAGRMGVGPGSAQVGRSFTTDSTSSRASFASSFGGFSQPGASFQFGSTTPVVNVGPSSSLGPSHQQEAKSPSITAQSQ